MTSSVRRRPGGPLGLTFACAKTAPRAITPEGARVRISRAEAVAGCVYVGDFVGGGGFGTKPGVGGWWETSQVQNLAAEKGATDVVLATAESGHVVGKGYRCP
jgi:hypothetical protein